ncbi:MAG TPA: pyruvate kinase, partial [Thermoplasmata archaeon]|nr:pyruvate kinase [Thermoplasmata archaeon]
MLGHYTTGLCFDAPWGDTKSSRQSMGRSPRGSGEPMPGSRRGLQHLLRRTRILVTLGPASSSLSAIRALIGAGADAFRINFSHGSPEEQRRLIRRTRAASRLLGREVAVVADLQGPKLRVGEIENRSILVEKNSRLRLDQDPAPGTPRRLSISVPNLRSAARPGDPLLLGDGNVELRVERVSSDSIQTRVVQGGTILSHQGIYLPRARLRGSILGSKDLSDLGLALSEGADFIALSFVGSYRDVREARRAVRRRTKAPVGLIAKIERASALDGIDGILHESDGIMVARGDLGIEVPLERLAIEQKRLVALAHQAGRPTIVATQMLLSMVSSPRPTRPEATDVANAILDGADAVMLSEESAIGAFPTQAVAWMDRIARVTETTIDRERFRAQRPSRGFPLTEEAVADAAVRTAEAI